VDGLVAQGTDLLVEINRAGKEGDRVVDFGLTDPADENSPRRTALTVPTGPSSQIEITLEGAQGEVTRAAGELTLDLFGFFQVSGQLAIERKDGELAAALLRDAHASASAARWEEEQSEEVRALRAQRAELQHRLQAWMIDCWQQAPVAAGQHILFFHKKTSQGIEKD
jgi:hypothetical protein